MTFIDDIKQRWAAAPEVVHIECECGGGKTGCAECFGDGFVRGRAPDDIARLVAEVERLQYAFERVSEEEDAARAEVERLAETLRRAVELIEETVLHNADQESYSELRAFLAGGAK